MCHNVTMKKGQIHPSTRLYMNMISDALIALLNKKEIGLITITELCDKAQVSRRTFYRHFIDKNGVVDYYVTKIMKNLALELRAVSPQDKRLFVVTFFQFFMPYTQLLLVLNKNGLGDIAFTSYIKCVTALAFPDTSIQDDTSKSVHEFQYNMAYMLGGLWSLLTYWIMNGCSKTPKELADIVCAS